MPKVNVNGCDIYYEVHGQGDPLVMIMGLRRNMEWWYHQIPVLSKHFKVIVFDNRGAGRSDKPEMDYSIRLFADDTAALMDELGIDHAHDCLPGRVRDSPLSHASVVISDVFQEPFDRVESVAAFISIPGVLLLRFVRLHDNKFTLGFEFSTDILVNKYEAFFRVEVVRS